ESLAERLQALGTVLVADFGLAGWFGVDYCLREGIPWPVEINPRYTASLEIHELASGRSLLEEHKSAFMKSTTAAPPPARTTPRRSRLMAKLIFYAPRRLVAPQIVPEENASNDFLAAPSIADVPWPGTCFDRGEPVMTLLAAGVDLKECTSRIRRLEQQSIHHFAPAHLPPPPP